MALALALNYKEGFPDWPIANILLLTAVYPHLLPLRLMFRVPLECL
jgi:hypothetical protein